MSSNLTQKMRTTAAQSPLQMLPKNVSKLNSNWQLIQTCLCLYTASLDAMVPVWRQRNVTLTLLQCRRFTSVGTVCRYTPSS